MEAAWDCGYADPNKVSKLDIKSTGRSTGSVASHCNVIISSRSHTAKGIQNHFQTVVTVNGFTRGKAEKFAFKILDDEKTVQDMLNFSPVDFQCTVP